MTADVKVPCLRCAGTGYETYNLPDGFMDREGCGTCGGHGEILQTYAVALELEGE